MKKLVFNAQMFFSVQENNLLKEHFGDVDFMMKYQSRIKCEIYPNHRKVYSFDDIGILTILPPEIVEGQFIFKYEVGAKIIDSIKESV